jgi:hypothetical protein
MLSGMELHMMETRTNRSPVSRCLGLAWRLFVFSMLSSAYAQLSPNARWWNEAIESRLGQAGTNRVELVKALNETPAARREGMVFLVENMPAAVFEDKSRGETADRNDFVVFKLVPTHKYHVLARLEGRVVESDVTARDNSADQLVTLILPR